jgi:MoxR-like ATPase
VTLEKILKLRSWIEKNVIVTDHFVDYFANMVLSTEPFTEEWMQLWDTKKRFRPVLKVMKAGISPRAAMALMKACKVRAFLFGTAEDGKSPRTCVMAEDLKELFPFAAKHRLYLTRAAQLRDNGGLELSEDDDVLPFREPNIQLDRPWTAEEVLELVNRKGPAPITPTVASLAVSSAWDHTDRLGGEPVRQSSLLARLAR